MSIINEPKIDCHCHVIDPVRFPYDPETPYRPSGQEIAPIDHFIRMMDLHGVRHALAQLSQLERLTGIFWGFADENGRVFKGWLLEIACSEDQAPFQGRGLA